MTKVIGWGFDPFSATGFFWLGKDFMKVLTDLKDQSVYVKIGPVEVFQNRGEPPRVRRLNDDNEEAS
jgi:hypothetical protein